MERASREGGHGALPGEGVRQAQGEAGGEVGAAAPRGHLTLGTEELGVMSPGLPARSGLLEASMEGRTCPFLPGPPPCQVRC